ncbi:unnamed protein product [Urochloa humidicola]
MTRGRRSAPPPTMGRRRRSDPLQAIGLPIKHGRTPPAGSIASIAAKLGNNGVLLLLLETPSGFAILSFDGVQLFLPGATENMWSNFGTDYMARHVVWLKEFKAFMDKSCAISFDTGVDRKLSKLILKWRQPGQMLIVGKPEYKTIIETSMVNERIVVSACALYDCDLIEKKHYASLERVGQHLKEVSGINAEDWSLLKLATALMIICYPEEEPLVGEEELMSD